MELAILEAVIHLLYVLGMLQVFYLWFDFLARKLTPKGFRIFTIFISLLFLIYIIATRYIFVLRLEQTSIPLPWILLFIVGSIGLLLRSITSFTLFLIPFVYIQFPVYYEKVYMEIPELPEERANTPTPNPNRPYYGGAFNRHTHHHHYPPHLPVPETKFYRNAGIGIACLGLCLSGFACWQAAKTANAAQVQAHAGERQAQAVEKQLAQWEVEKGVISLEEYRKKFGPKG